MVEIMSALHAVNFGLEADFFGCPFKGDALQVVHDLYMAFPLSLINRTRHFVIISTKQVPSSFSSS
jgi:hypothetical protein